METIKRAFIGLIIILLLPLRGLAITPGPESILGEAAILMDGDTGQVLYEKNAYDSRQPASITKIMTGMLAMERLSNHTVMTASAAAVDIPSWGSSAYIKAGERLTVEQAMYAMMLKSANEAANILAEEVAGSMSAFARLMNARAVELGAQGTNFTNANGLPARNHVTTAYDMALITRQAIRTPGFLAYFGAATYDMPSTNRTGPRSFTNTHRMLLRDYGVYNPEVIGGKTGYTVPAGYTLVTVAQRGDRTLICVVLGSSSYYTDTQTLLDFGFDAFSSHTYAFSPDQSMEASIWDGSWKAGRVTFQTPEPVTILLHNSQSLSDISVSYEYPLALRAEEAVEGSAVVTIPGDQDALPDTVLTIPLEPKVDAYQRPRAEPMAVRFDSEIQSSSVDISWLTARVAMVLMGVTALTLVLIIRLEYRRRR